MNRLVEADMKVLIGWADYSKLDAPRITVGKKHFLARSATDTADCVQRTGAVEITS